MNLEDTEKKSQAAIDELASALEAGRSETLERYLEMLSRFHRYSFGNCLLICCQYPQATHVAGFTKWKELGRFVKKGERGIAILAPLISKRKVDDESKDAQDEASENSAPWVLRGFRVVHVFDVSQTDGKELPEFASISGDPGENLAKLEAVTRRLGISLSYEIIPGGALGLSSDGAITVVPHLSKALSFSVLCHEVAHELLHKTERRKETSKAIRETEAEAVSFVVCKAIGLDAGTRSSDYIQLWSGDKETLMESLDYIQKTAAKLIQEIQSTDVLTSPLTADSVPVQSEAQVSSM